tara:strand:- start:20 stop:247 length:228 start_codon:yes stop_codon:yes gene_type:complete
VINTKVTDAGLLIFFDLKNVSKGKEISDMNIDRKNGIIILSATLSPANMIMSPLRVNIVLYIGLLFGCIFFNSNF